VPSSNQSINLYCYFRESRYFGPHTVLYCYDRESFYCEQELGKTLSSNDVNLTGRLFLIILKTSHSFENNQFFCYEI